MIELIALLKEICERRWQEVGRCERDSINMLGQTGNEQTNE